MQETKVARPSDQEVAAPSPVKAGLILPAYPNIGTPKDAGEALRVPESTIRQLCRDGQLKAFKLGTNWRIPKAWLLEFIEVGGCAGQPSPLPRGGDALCAK